MAVALGQLSRASIAACSTASTRRSGEPPQRSSSSRPKSTTTSPPVVSATTTGTRPPDPTRMESGWSLRWYVAKCTGSRARHARQSARSRIRPWVTSHSAQWARPIRARRKYDSSPSGVPSASYTPTSRSIVDEAFTMHIVDACVGPTVGSAYESGSGLQPDVNSLPSRQQRTPTVGNATNPRPTDAGTARNDPIASARNVTRDTGGIDFATNGDYHHASGSVPGRPPALPRRNVGADDTGQGAEPMKPMEFLFLSDGRLFIRHASGEILEAEASARRHAASLMLALEEIAPVDPARGLALIPPAPS